MDQDLNNTLRHSFPPCPEQNFPSSLLSTAKPADQLLQLPNSNEVFSGSRSERNHRSKSSSSLKHSKSKRKSELKDNEELLFVNDQLKFFKPSSSAAWKLLEFHFGPKITQEELLSLAMVVSTYTGISLYREYKRRKGMLIKWFDDNLTQIWPFILQHIVVTGRDNQVIGPQNRQNLAIAQNNQ
ncbi:hypothetical protein M9Y10_026507 [Tritrichomonas musculus]|uniref:Uncharacterized protein n=1 Tax=Tritrichomonas musculus TaxID=1915356 RepID=A0ABR2H7S4_9EUKA